MGRQRLAFFGAVLLAVLAAAGGAKAQTPQQPQSSQAAADEQQKQDVEAALGDKVRAIKQKYFIKDGRFEVGLFAGLSLNDPFKKRLPVGGHLVYHLADSMAVGLTALYNLNLPSSDVVIVRRSGAAPEVADLKFNASLDFYFSPIYGKFAVLSEWIVNYDAYLVVGFGGLAAGIPSEAAVSSLTTGGGGSDSSFALAGNVGLGTRWFLARWLALNLEIRDYIYSLRLTNVADTELSDIQNLIIPFLGVSFYIPFSVED